MTEDIRLERVEKHIDKLGDKIDELTKVVTAMARIEERMITLFRRMDSYESRHEHLDSRVKSIEQGSTKHSVVFGLFDKVFWIIVGGIIAYVVKIVGV
jgi:hypothetical protein